MAVITEGRIVDKMCMTANYLMSQCIASEMLYDISGGYYGAWVMLCHVIIVRELCSFMAHATSSYITKRCDVSLYDCELMVVDAKWMGKYMK